MNDRRRIVKCCDCNLRFATAAGKTQCRRCRVRAVDETANVFESVTTAHGATSLLDNNNTAGGHNNISPASQNTHDHDALPTSSLPGGGESSRRPPPSTTSPEARPSKKPKESVNNTLISVIATSSNGVASSKKSRPYLEEIYKKAKEEENIRAEADGLLHNVCHKQEDDENEMMACDVDQVMNTVDHEMNRESNERNDEAMGLLDKGKDEEAAGKTGEFITFVIQILFQRLISLLIYFVVGLIQYRDTCPRLAIHCIRTVEGYKRRPLLLLVFARP